MSAPRVVLVDDTEDLRHLMRIALKRAGYEVVGEAGDGVEGIEVARKHRPDLVVLDLSMPVMDGLEALPHIRTSCPDATIVVMSGFGAAQMSERAVVRGADGYLQKGSPLSSVVEYLGAALARRGGVAAPESSRSSEAPPGPEIAELTPVAVLEVADQGGLPVRYAKAAARELLGDELDPDAVAELTDAMVRQARILDGLTTDLLTTAQVRQGTLTLQLRDVRPADVVVAVLAGRYDAGVAVTDERTVRADPLRLEQMLSNLLSNARKYGRPPVDVRVLPAGDHVAIEVADHGDGVPEEFQDRLFEEFARADPATATGSGLGLHVVRTLAEAQGGTASYAPGPDGGAVFRIGLPAV